MTWTDNFEELLDELDRKILAILKENSRRSFTSIAREINISEAAVRKRVSKLVKGGIIRKFTIEINMGFSAIILVSVEPKIPCPEVSRKILEIEGVNKVYEISGEYDIAAIISTPDYKSANEIIERIRGIEGVRRTYTSAILKIH